MRARNIKPSIWDNEDLADCEPLARLLFIGLWGVADREGRLEDRPRRLKHQILGYDDCGIDQLIEQLASKGFITRYRVGSDSYILVTGFVEHQRPHQNEVNSALPPPPDSERKAAEARHSTGSKPGAHPKVRRAREKEVLDPSDPGSLIPERGDRESASAQTTQGLALDPTDETAIAAFRVATHHELPAEKMAEYREFYADVNLAQAFYEIGSCLDSWIAGEQGPKKKCRAERYRRDGPEGSGFWSFVLQFVKPDRRRGTKDGGAPESIAGRIPERLRA